MDRQGREADADHRSAGAVLAARGAARVRPGNALSRLDRLAEVSCGRRHCDDAAPVSVRTGRIEAGAVDAAEGNLWNAQLRCVGAYRMVNKWKQPNRKL